MIRRLVLVALIAAMVFAIGVRLFAADESWDLAENRVWIERMPRTPRDMTRKIVFVHGEGERIGAIVHSSEFRMHLDKFFWFARDDGRVRITFPQDQKERMPQARAWRCAGEAPAPFELCLELREGEEKRSFFSMEEWVIDAVDDLDEPEAAWARVGEVEGVSDVGGDGEDESAP